MIDNDKGHVTSCEPLQLQISRAVCLPQGRTGPGVTQHVRAGRKTDERPRPEEKSRSIETER